MKRLLTGLTTIGIFCLIILLAAGWYAVEMRRINRDKQYAEMRATTRNQIRVTIPEGWRREQIAALLEADAVTGSADFLDATKNDEGQLFPDTYFFYAATPANQVRDRLRQTYDAKAPAVDQATLIIASIVEREAKKDAERADIAEIYWNRLKVGMTFDADPTPSRRSPARAR